MNGSSQRAPRWVWALGLTGLALWAAWSFQLALNLPIDSWDAYDYLVNARWLAGHDLTRLAQTYRGDRPPGISLLVAPLLALGYQPGQRGTAGLVHLVPWSLGAAAVFVLWRSLRKSVGVALAFVGAGLLVINPLMVHSLPFVMADVASMTFVLGALVLAERVAAGGALRHGALLAVVVALALSTKYPVAVLGVLIPLGNAAWSFVGAGRPVTWKGRFFSAVSPALAVSLGGGLLVAVGLHAAIAATVLKGDGPLWRRTTAGLTTSWNQGSSVSATDPWWELPNALLGTFGPVVIALAMVGAVAGLVVRDRASLLHLTWVIGFLAMFAFVIGHKESRYAFPVLPSVVWLAMRGLSLVQFLPRVLAGGVVVTVLGAAPPALAELRRMADPLYTRPSVLAWARFALDRAGAEKPIMQSPPIGLFALYAKQPVVFETDEFWHYHHFNEGGLVWFFDRRLQHLQVSQGAAPGVRTDPITQAVTVPVSWLQRAGDDAVWLAGFPKGGVLVSTGQGWFETRTVAQQNEPPAPFVGTDVTRVTLERATLDATTATFGNGDTTVTATRGPSGWVLSPTATPRRWYLWEADGTPTRWVEPVPEAPVRLDGLFTERVEFSVRP